MGDGLLNRQSVLRGTAVVKIAVMCLSALFVSVYLTRFVCYSLGLSGGLIDTILRALPLFLLFSMAIYVLCFDAKPILGYAFKYRYVIGAALFGFCLVFELSGSSIGVWSSLLGGAEGSDPLWGVPREVRSDEWAITTPFILAQDHNGYQSITEIIRGTQTEVSLLPSLPSLALIEVFKPQYWGFLLLGASRGLAWMWSLVIIALFLITLEFFLLITKGNRWLSCCAAVIMTFSPFAQWWACFEFLLYGQLIVLLANSFLRGKNRLVRIASAALIPWSAGCLLFKAYPAWLVLCFYVFMVFGVWVIATYFRSIDMSVRLWLRRRVPELCALLACFALVALMIVVVFQDAAMAVAGMASTIYPGSRIFTGGTNCIIFFDWIPSPFFAITSPDFISWDPIANNQCESSAYFSLFPLGIILGIFAAVKWRRPLLAVLIALDLVFLAFIAVGFPEAVAKITLLSYVGIPSRILLATGFLDIAILFISLSMLSHDKGDRLQDAKHQVHLHTVATPLVLAGSFVVALALCVVCRTWVPEFWNKCNLLLLFLGSAAVSISLCLYFSAFRELASKCLCISICAIVLTSGICVNPLQRGVSPITEGAAYQAIESIAAEDNEGLWIAEGPFVFGNLLAAAGVPSANSTNTYPNVELWQTLDPSGGQEEAYLRYANIDVSLQDESESDTFELLGSDYIRLNLTPEDLKKMNVKYLLATQPHESADGVIFKKLDVAGNFIIYELVY